MKTPEEMAEEWLENRKAYPSCIDIPTKICLQSQAREGFLAGYKAAQDQIADMRNYLEKAFQAGHLFMATGVDFDEWYARVFLAKQQLADVSKVMTKPPKEEK